MYTRNCPKCKKELTYKYKQSFKKAGLDNSLCKSCGGLGKKFTDDHKKKISTKAKLRVGEKNPFYGKYHTQETKDEIKNSLSGRILSKEHRKNISDSLKNSDRVINKRNNYYYWEKNYGKEEADNRQNKWLNKLSIKFSGENNPMYGKPSPQGSGNGWCGWYKNIHFRSLLELSFIIYYIERFNFKFETAETKKYKIDYIDYKNTNRTYHPDYILNDKYLIEIKPKHLMKCKDIILKKEAAIKYCNENNLIYKLLEPIKKININDIHTLIDNKLLIFTDRYKIKYDKYLLR